MGFNVPFSCNSLPFPVPRRMAFVVGSVICIVLLLNLLAPSALPPAISRYPHHEPDASYFSGSKWIPPLLNPNTPDRPAEWDDNGHCLFLSPFGALSPAEKAAAEHMRLIEVSPGVVRVQNATSPSGKSLNPILALLREGEKKWNNLLASQSQSLEQAVKKYESKWGRPPPKGFDDWWLFARDRDTLLMDEFDSIMDVLLPFYGLPIASLKARLEETEKLPETFTVIVKRGKVELQWNDDYSRHKWLTSRGRADSQINLMEPFINFVGDFRATYSIHDQPSILVDYARMKELKDAASSHKVSTQPDEKDLPTRDWAKTCPPGSPLNKGVKEELASDTFISNHLATMDICTHPSLMDTHSILLDKKNSDGPTPHTKLLPLFSSSKLTANGDIGITPVGTDTLRDDVGRDLAWSRKSGKVYWRGHSSTINNDQESDPRSHHDRLHKLANEQSSTMVDVLVPLGSSGETEIKSYPIKTLGNYYMNSKLVGEPVHCEEGDFACKDMVRALMKSTPLDEVIKHKYVIDVDGNPLSSRFPRLMATLNVVIKSTILPEWNSAYLPEWFAYVPAKVDYSELYSIMSFFRGTPNGKGSHDEVARRIALNSQCWAERTSRRDDLQVYMFRLYLEYARLISPDRDSGKMDFVLQDYHRDKPVNPPKPARPKADTMKEIEALPGIDQ